jgi:hypothetical protein
VNTLINAFAVVAVGGFLTYVTLDRYRQLRQEFRTEIRTEISGLRQQMKSDIAHLEARVDEGTSAVARLEARMDAGFNAVRSDLTAVALAVGARAPRAAPETGRT